MNKQDLRYVKTENVIHQGFKRCLQFKKFEKISIADICTEAQISRNTFYAHYHDKFEILDRYYEKLNTDAWNIYHPEMVTAVLRGELDWMTAWYIDVIDKNREIALILLSCDYDHFVSFVRIQFFEKALTNAIPNVERKISSDIVQFSISYMVGGLMEFTKLWLKRYDKLTKEEVTDTFEEIIRGIVELIAKKIL